MRISNLCNTVTNRKLWEAKASCHQAVAQAEAKQTPEPAVEVETPIAHTDKTEETPIAPAAIAIALAETTAATTATTTNDQPPNRGDNGSNRVELISAKKLMLSLVSVKRITSDVAVCNFDCNELEIAGELSLALGGFAIPRRDGARQQRIQSRKRAFSVSRRSSGEAVKSQSGRNYSGDHPRIRKSISSSRATQNVEVLRLDAVAPSQKSDGAVKNLSILHNSPKIYPLLLAQVNTTIKV